MIFFNICKTIFYEYIQQSGYFVRFNDFFLKKGGINYSVNHCFEHNLGLTCTNSIDFLKCTEKRNAFVLKNDIFQTLS